MMEISIYQFKTYIFNYVYTKASPKHVFSISVGTFLFLINSRQLKRFLTTLSKSCVTSTSALQFSLND